MKIRTNEHAYTYLHTLKRHHIRRTNTHGCMHWEEWVGSELHGNGMEPEWTGQQKLHLGGVS